MPTQVIPREQHALQLIGPEKLQLNKNKPVPEPGPQQFLCRVVVVGACFSDLKLLKQFSNHARKSEVISGIDPSVLAENPCYVPGDKPAVPGHEPVVEIVKTGSQVQHFKEGAQYFVQADWRWLKTAHANGAFGYNFEGAMQEYTILDERIIFSPEGECMLLPIEQGKRSASAFSLVEPWACVEESYQVKERRNLKDGGKLLVFAEETPDEGAIAELLQNENCPAGLTWGGKAPDKSMHLTADTVQSVDELEDSTFDDVIYFGCNADTVEKLFAKCADHGLINIVLCGDRFERDIVTPLGAVHYQGLRITGTSGQNPADGLNNIPATGEIRDGDTIDVVGAGGPMGTMHAVRNLRRGIADIKVYAGDLSDERLAVLNQIAVPTAKEAGIEYKSYNPKDSPLEEDVDYSVIMVPVPELVAEAVKKTKCNGIINLFAGIPTDKSGDIDMNSYICNGLYFIGTSGSVMEDMRIVLDRVRKGQLDTNVSVAAVCGLDGAPEALEAIKNQDVDGKIMIYPECKGLELTKLSELKEKAPTVADKLDNGVWTMGAENALLEEFGG